MRKNRSIDQLQFNDIDSNNNIIQIKERFSIGKKVRTNFPSELKKFNSKIL